MYFAQRSKRLFFIYTVTDFSGSDMCFQDKIKMSDEGKLFIGGLSYETNEDSLAAAFSKYGTIEKGDFFLEDSFVANHFSISFKAFSITRFCCKYLIMLFFFRVLVDVIRDKETGRSRGFGFVKYDNAEDAKDALDAMNGKVRKRSLFTTNLFPQNRD